MAENQAENRRPLKTRSHKWANKLAKYLAGKSITPNQISLSSMGFAGVAMMGAIFWNMVGVTFVQVFFLLLIIVGVQGRLLCNLIDGMVAIEGGKKTPAGELYNDIPDRISDAVIFIGLGAGLASTMPFALVLGLCAALVAVLTAYIRALGVSMGTPAYFCGPMAKQHRMALVTGGTVVTIASVIYGASYSPWFFYLVLLIVIFGSGYTCFNRIMKIKIFLEEQARQKSVEPSVATEVADAHK
ncbi:MAG: CDP-alcohol phosphatidyltransferase family protein, partial [Saezia sp.]